MILIVVAVVAVIRKSGKEKIYLGGRGDTKSLEKTCKTQKKNVKSRKLSKFLKIFKNTRNI